MPRKRKQKKSNWVINGLSIALLLILLLSFVSLTSEEQQAKAVEAPGCGYASRYQVAPAGGSRLPVLYFGRIVGEVGYDPAANMLTLYINHLEYESKQIEDNGHAIVQVTVGSDVVATEIRACGNDLYYVMQQMDARNIPAFMIEFDGSPGETVVYLNYP